MAKTSAVFPRESATSGWTSPVWMTFDTAWRSPRDACRISCSDRTSSGPLGPKGSLFRAKTAPTSQLKFSAASLKKRFHEPISTPAKAAQCVFNSFRCVCDLCLWMCVSIRARRVRLEAGSRSPGESSASHSSET